jgi:hypothetical protein
VKKLTIINNKNYERRHSMKTSIIAYLFLFVFCVVQASAQECDPECVNGDCIALNTCMCYAGWAGAICDQPVCDPECVNGDCTAPDTCMCYAGWAGAICDQPATGIPTLSEWGIIIFMAVILGIGVVILRKRRMV